MKKRGFVLACLLASSFLLSGDQLIRAYLNTGDWYPSDRVKLQKMVDSLLANAPTRPLAGRVMAIIAPHAAFQYSGKCAASAYAYLRNQKDIRRVVLMGSSHRDKFYGAFISHHTQFTTPLGSVPVDLDAMAELSLKPFFRWSDITMLEEHALENQLPFLQRTLAGIPFKIVPILFGGMNADDFPRVANMLSFLIDDQTLIVVSSDFTHYGPEFDFVPFTTDLPKNLTKMDKGLIETILNLDFKAAFRYRMDTRITVCGFVPIGILMNMVDPKKTAVIETSYYKSGDLSGDYEHCVSYASLLFHAKIVQPARSEESHDAPDSESGPLNKSEQRILLDLARQTLKYNAEKGQVPTIEDLNFPIPEKLKKKNGVFVTLRQKGELRGCIGSIVGNYPLYEGVMANAINAALHDPRFPPLTKEELPKTTIEISVLSSLQRIYNWQEVRLGIDGLMIRDGSYQAIFLPQVATETGWDIDTFMIQLCRKAGLKDNAYKTSKTMQFLNFQAHVFAE